MGRRCFPLFSHSPPRLGLPPWRIVKKTSIQVLRRLSQRLGSPAFDAWLEAPDEPSVGLRMLEALPEHPAAQTCQALLHLISGDPAAAHHLAALPEHPEPLREERFEAKLVAGNACTSLGLFTEALEHIEAAEDLAERPDEQCRLHSAWAMALEWHGDPTSALPHARLALDLSATEEVRFIADINVGSLELLTGNIANARESLARTQRMNPGRTAFLSCYLEGNILEKEGAPEDAIAAFRRCRQMKPDPSTDLHALLGIARCLRDQGKTEQAIGTLLHTVQRPWTSIAARERAMLLEALFEDRGDLRDALRWAREHRKLEEAQRSTCSRTRRQVLIDLRYRALRRRSKAIQEREKRADKAERFEAMGRVAAGIAHDFNNILAVQLDLARSAAQDGNAHASLLEETVLTARALTRQLMRLQQHRPAPEPAAQSIRSIEALLRRAVTRKLRFDISLESGDAYAAASAVELQQVVLNLVSNARNAIRESGVGGAINLTLRADADSVHLEVSDDGPGIPLSLRQRVQRAYFTTRSEGTGLGLSIVRGITAKANGAFSIDSPEGRRGTVVRCSFPRVSAPTKVARDGRLTRSRNFLRLLIVDDEAAVARAIGRQARQLGHQVEQAQDIQRGIDLLRWSDYDAVLCDATIPGGLEPLQSALPPNTSLVVMSGMDWSGSAPFLLKPFTAQELDTVLEAL